jgi:hypothetical protein
MDNLVWVTYSCTHWHIDMARELLANRHLHQLPYSEFNPQVLILRSWHEEILEQLQNHVAQNYP